MYKVVKIENTYAWIIATAASNIINIIWIIIIIDKIILLISVDLFPNNLINKWPAIILAVNRTANLPGRIILLIVSINTIKGINTLGVPLGTKWVNIILVFLNHPNSIMDNHKGKAMVREKVKCLVLVKIYGISPKKLFIRININKETVIKVIPLEFNPNNILNSLCNFVIIILIITLFRFGNVQNEYGINNIPIKDLNQFIE